MTKKELVEKLYYEFQSVLRTKKNSEEIVHFVFDEMYNTLVRKEEVGISHFGKFKIVRHKARVGVNPQTGGKIKISARNVVKFIPTTTLKENIK